MYRSEKQATQRQNKTSIEEAYFQRPFDTKNYNDSTKEYTYDIPQQFATNPSQEKTIGVRRVRLIPSAFKVHIKVEYGDVTDLTTAYIEGEFDFQAGNTMIEILHEIADELVTTHKTKSCKLTWEYDGNTLKVIPTWGGKIDGNLQAKITSNTEDEFLRLFNQLSTIGILGTVFDSDIPLTLHNVWNRSEVFVHASFSNSTNRFICSTNDFYEEISKRFEDNTYQSTFNVFYTTDGFVRIAPLSAAVLIELSFKIR